jgi:hypothetical protein
MEDAETSANGKQDGERRARFSASKTCYEEQHGQRKPSGSSGGRGSQAMARRRLRQAATLVSIPGGNVVAARGLDRMATVNVAPSSSARMESPARTQHPRAVAERSDQGSHEMQRRQMHTGARRTVPRLGFVVVEQLT